MRSDAEIRKGVETRLKRWGLLLVHCGVWIKAGFVWWQVWQTGSLGQWTGLATILMVVWTMLLGLHSLRVIYVELREYLVRRAIERERQLYLLGDDEPYEKRKHDDAVPRLELSEDGELIDFPMREDSNYERRS